MKMESITLKYEEQADDDDDDEGLTNVKAKVFRNGKEIGVIGGIQVGRTRIGENSFHMTFDEHSGDLEWVGSTLLENRYGRTKLQSLRDAGDDMEFDFFYIDTFYIDANESGDVATHALRKFLHGDKIKGDAGYGGCWMNSSVAYVLHEESNNDEGATGKRKRGDETNTYHEVIPFLRNGFFQDPAIISGGNQANARILVGGVSHFEKDLLSESEAKAKASRLVKSGSSNSKKVKGDDVEILNLVRNIVNDPNYQMSLMQGVSSAMAGQTQYTRPMDITTDQQVGTLKQQIQRLQSSGGSIARSGALQAACEENLIKIAKLLIQLDQSSVNTKDTLGRTPLIMAGINAAGRCSINGIDGSDVIDALLNAGASKSDVDSSNMTAYGHFKSVSSRWLQMTRYEHRHTVTDIEHKLYPAGGPTTSDFAEGRGGSSGLVDYSPEDDEADRMWGRDADAENGDY